MLVCNDLDKLKSKTIWIAQLIDIVQHLDPFVFPFLPKSKPLSKSIVTGNLSQLC